MPWTTLREPSLGLGILSAILGRNGISCRILHLNIFLLQLLRWETYHGLSRAYALNDFIFSGILDPTITNSQQRWLRDKVRELMGGRVFDPQLFGGSEGLVEKLLNLRNAIIPDWLAEWADVIASEEANLIGFTCMFDQTIASLALAKLISKRAPDKIIVFGGYAVKSPTAQMILRSSPWIDAICDGEGEVTIVELARYAAGEIPLTAVSGIVFRSPSNELISTPSPPQVDLNLNPTPNFDDFFADVRRLSEEYLVDIVPVSLPIENSRGCWWGMKSHCVFCGIKDADLAYRARDARIALETLAELHQRYGIKEFRFSDNILPTQYFDTLLPQLVKLGSPYQLACEMKSNINEGRFALLARSGFIAVQPGIESFSFNVLNQMRKGVLPVQNVYTLLLGCRFGVRVNWNLLYGFPNDEPSEYDMMRTLLPRLVHLDPPVSCIPVQITRHAPLEKEPERFGIAKATAEPFYALIFSEHYINQTGFDIQDYCYYFERPFVNSLKLQLIYDQINEIVANWRTLYSSKKVWLFREGIDNSDEIIIHDKRGSEEIVYRLNSSEAEVLIACSGPLSMNSLRELKFQKVVHFEIDRVIDKLDDFGLIFREGKHIVSLVMPEPPEGVISDSGC